MVRVIEETGGTHLRRLDCEKRAPGIEARSESSLRNVVMKGECDHACVEKADERASDRYSGRVLPTFGGTEV